METRIIAAFVIAMGCPPTFAQEAILNNTVTIPRTEVINIHSTSADADYQLWVAHPMAGVMPLPQEPRKVLYVLDANLFFGTAVEMTRLMSQLYGELPPLLVVGIAYDTSDPLIQSELRSRDFTPTADSGFGAMSSPLPGAPQPTLPEGRRFGRAAEFLAFLVDEVQPLIREKYDVADGGSTLFGSSLGGLFTAYAMLERPGAFDGYIVVSPALWWDDRTLMKRAAETDRLNEDSDVTMFLAVGGDEERADIPMLAQFRMISNLREFAKMLQLKDMSSLKVSTLIAEGESHTTVVPVALTKGLRQMYPPQKPAWMP